VSPGYQEIRLGHSSQREALWKGLSKYLQRWVDTASPALDIGSGRSDFLQHVQSSRKVAIDVDSTAFGDPIDGLEQIVSDATQLDLFADGSFGTVLASNFLEHLEWEQVEKCLGECFRVLRPGGRLIVIQPNFALKPQQYFDDYTHRTIFTHQSLTDWLRVIGFEITFSEPKFLPLTLNSRLRHGHRLLNVYLALPFKPFAGQMLVVATRPH